MNGPGLNGTLSAPSSRGIFSGDQPSIAKQQIVSKRDLRVPKFSKKAGYPRWCKKLKFFTSEVADALDYDSDTASRAIKKKYNNVMLRALVEAGDDDEQFFDIVDAATEVPHATYKTVLVALDKFYGRGVVTELMSALLSLIKFSTDTETDPITRLTKFNERQSKVTKQNYATDGFLQLVIFAAGLEREDQEKIWRFVSTHYERTGDLPSLEDLRSEVEAMGTARAAAGGGGVMKEKIKPEEVGMEFSGAVICRGPKI